MGTGTTIRLDTPVHLVDHGGRGDLVVLLHGLGGSADDWLAVGDRIAAAGHRVVAPDLYGFGITPPGLRGSTVEANAELVLDLVEHLHGEGAALVGNSMGGLTALIAAAERPDLVSRLVLADPAAPMRSWRRAVPSVVARLAAPLLPGVGTLGLRAYRASRSPKQEADEALALVTSHPERVPPQVREALVERYRLRRKLSWEIPAYVEASRSIARWVLEPHRYWRLVHRIVAPALVVHGSADRLVPLDAARRLVEERPDWELVVFDDAGHAPHMEAPDRFVEVVVGWVGVSDAEGRRPGSGRTAS